MPLGSIRGMMFYFYDKRYNSIVLETATGANEGTSVIVKMNTMQPETNKQILIDLQAKLHQLENLHNKKIKENEVKQ